LLLPLLPPNPTPTAAPDPAPAAGGGATARVRPRQPSLALAFVLTSSPATDPPCSYWLAFVGHRLCWLALPALVLTAPLCLRSHSLVPARSRLCVHSSVCLSSLVRSVGRRLCWLALPLLFLPPPLCFRSFALTRPSLPLVRVCTSCPPSFALARAGPLSFACPFLRLFVFARSFLLVCA
jgi:hypothetical protein